ncbi:MAG: apolipoprotein N-acyltransferase [Spirochaetes bacterium]|nr:MAG: apolipoprotein N-acyltransferase [Spirochaetota bacterium]
MVLTDFVLVIVSALLYALGLPNELLHYGNPVFGFIAIVPFLYVLYRQDRLSRTVLFGAVFALISTVSVYFWLLFFQDFSIWTLSGVAAAHILYFLVLAPILFTALKYPPHIRPFLTAGVWVIYEFLKSTGYLGLPWGLLAHTSITFLPLIQISDITGQWGVSFLFALINTAILEILIDPKPLRRSLCGSSGRTAAFTLILLILTLVYGTFSLKRSYPETAVLDAVLVQQNADSWVAGNEMESIRQGQVLTREALNSAAVKPDIIIWSENAFRYPYIKNSIRYRRNPTGDPFNSFLKEIDTPILIGSPYILDPKTYSALNAVMLVNPEGDILEYYGKTHPVPFAENIPFWNLSFVRAFFIKVLGIPSQGWNIGIPNIIFEIKNKGGESVSFGSPICFEDTFPYIARGFFKNGADILINLSNDSWSKTISGETQHYAAALFRAVENRRTLVRSTNAGVTVVIDPYGIGRNMLPLFVSTAENVQIPVYRTAQTFYMRFGDWFPVVLLILLTSIQFYTIKTGNSLYGYRLK